MSATQITEDTGSGWGFITSTGRTFTGYRSREAAEAGLAAHEMSDPFEEDER